MKETLWGSLDRAVDWVKYAEAKGLAILGVHAITLGFFMNLVVDRHEDLRNSFWVLTCLFFALFSAFSSIYFSFKCLNPRLKLSGGVSPIYFRSVATSFKTSSEFLAYMKLKMGDDAGVEHEVAGQVFVNFNIASKKFEDVTWALRLLVCSLPFWTATAILLIFP